ncbi:MAG TPA: energy transducer TonB [Candidatus Elarobacter sp.]|jgi:TonB family protein
MRRFGSALLTLGLLVAAAPAHAAVPDRLADLAGMWTCRTAVGGSARIAVEQPAPDTVVMTEQRFFPRGTEERRETFRRDASGNWTVTPDGAGFAGSAPAWTGDSWIMQGEMQHPGGGASLIRDWRFERVGPNMLRITQTLGRPDANADGELCRRGDEPPSVTACVVPTFPAYVVHAAPVDTPPMAQQQGIGGTVHVVVSLDADGHVTGVRIQDSPSALLNNPSLFAARNSTYHPAVKDCVPVPSLYVFQADYLKVR